MCRNLNPSLNVWHTHPKLSVTQLQFLVRKLCLGTMVEQHFGVMLPFPLPALLPPIFCFYGRFNRDIKGREHHCPRYGKTSCYTRFRSSTFKEGALPWHSGGRRMRRQ